VSEQRSPISPLEALTMHARNLATSEEVAVTLHLDVRTVRRLGASRGICGTFPVKVGGQWRWDLDALLAAVKL